MSDYKVILGLDLGSNSIGWALVRTDGETIRTSEPIALGSRIIPSCMDPKKDEPKNRKRRTKRGMRRQIARRSRRKKNLRVALTAIGFLPSDPDALKQLFETTDPYVLRDRAISQQISLHELGRVLMHLSQRRGFLSNRKSTSEAKDKNDEKGILGSIKQLESELGDQTLGQFMAEKHKDPHQPIRGQFTRRSMFQFEFDKIWETQQAFYPSILTDQLKYGQTGELKYPALPIPRKHKFTLLETFGLHGMIFFQRKMYWPAYMVGRCELEKTEKRAPRSDRRFQLFRILQEVNNLRVVSLRSPDRFLNQVERAKLIEILKKGKDCTFDDMRKKLDLPGVMFNTEIHGRKKLDGHKTDFYFSNEKEKLFGKDWAKKSESFKNNLVEVLNGSLEDSEIYDLAISEWGVSPELAEKLSTLSIPVAGYGSYSIMAIEKLIPYLEQGFTLQANDETDSAIHKAGYHRKDETVINARPTLPKVPDSITNPIVRHNLHEVRRLIHAVIREYGMPDEIHIELAREIKGNSIQRAEMTKRNLANRKAREEAEKTIKNYLHAPTPEDINRYLLWENQNEQCLYSGRMISLPLLFSGRGEIQVDHILPRSRTLDNSASNKVLCFANENHEKANRTPFEWLDPDNPEKYQEILKRVNALEERIKKPLFKNITCKELIDESFVSRQLIDTAYISRMVHGFIQQLGVKVVCVKGRHTSELRRIWQLNHLIREDGLNIKNRSDHRHHAIDALIIALTNHKALQTLAWYWKTRHESSREQVREQMELLIGTEFREKAAELINQVVVSHKCVRKVRGALNAEFYYGKTQKMDYPIPKDQRPHAKLWQEDPGKIVIRVKLKDLPATDVKDIRDPVVKAIIMERLALRGLSTESKDIHKTDWWIKPEALRMKSKTGIGPKIESVRILMDNNFTDKKTGERLYIPIRDGSLLVKAEKRDHIAIFEMPGSTPKKPKREMISVSLLKTTQKKRVNRDRKQQGEDAMPMVDRNHPHEPNAVFLMSLATNELVFGEFKGHRDYYVYNTADSTSGQMFFYHHCDSERNHRSSCKPKTMNFQKIQVDILGRVRPASD